jgi:hypothetical protein
MNAWDLLKSIGVFAVGSTVLLTALGFIARNVFVHFLSHDLESHKAKLAADNGLALEKFKAKLQAAAFEHETRFSHLHEERGKVIAELYRRLAIADEEIQIMLVLLRSGRNTDEGRRLKASDAMNSFRDYFDQHRCYFDRAFCELMNTLSTSLFRTWGDPEFKNAATAIQDAGAFEARLDKTVMGLVNVRGEIEARLRDMLGVGEPTTAEILKAHEITLQGM